MQIELQDVFKTYGRTRALDGVCMSIDPGQIVAILGSNGAGKSTLLRTLAGIVAPDRGAVLLDGRPLRREDLSLRRRLHFLPDFPLLFFEQSVARNLSTFLRLYERDTKDAAARCLELLRAFDLLPLAATPVGTLSRGQIFKTALSALIAVDPELWLLDEPLASGMDPHGVVAFKHEAREATRRGRTVVFSTQMLETAERLADRVCIIDQGRVRVFAPIKELSAQAADPQNPLEEIFQRLREEKT